MQRKVFLINSKKIDSDILYLSLLPKDGNNLPFKPGNFVKIYSLSPSQAPASRFYSITSTPSSKTLEFGIKIVGQFTNYLSSLEKGMEIGVEGPYPKFSFSNQKQMILLAGGIGISPIISILRTIEEKRIRGKFILFYSNKDANFPFYEELKALSKNSSIRIIFTITREVPSDWKGETGRLSGEMICKYYADLSGFEAFICGPSQMALVAKECLTNLGIKEEDIDIEAWA